MEDRLKNLKKVMDQQTFNDLTFTEKHKKNILERTTGQKNSDDDIQLAILQLLIQAKTGHELTVLLLGRGIKSFENNEGSLYPVLHQLEQKGCLHSFWDEEGGKFYQLNDKGKRFLKKAENKHTKQRFVLKALFEGGGE